MPKQPIHIFFHNDCLLHEMGGFHPESPERIQAIIQELTHSSLPLEWHTAHPADNNLLQATHDPQLVEKIRTNAPKQGYYYLGPDVVMNRFTLQAAQLAAGSVIDAVDWIYQHQAQQAFCLVRPPGHHAEYNQAMGFCFFNNLACAALYARNKYAAQRVGIIDFDVHHGNGTQNIVQHLESVLFCSSFQHPFYPFSAVIENHPQIIHLPLAAKTAGKEYRQRFEDSFLPRLEAFRPDILFVSAGFDAHKLDPIGGLNLNEEDFFWLGETLGGLAKKSAENKIISVLEGGYHVQALAQSVHNYLAGLQLSTL